MCHVQHHGTELYWRFEKEFPAQNVRTSVIYGLMVPSFFCYSHMGLPLIFPWMLHFRLTCQHFFLAFCHCPVPRSLSFRVRWSRQRARPLRPRKCPPKQVAASLGMGMKELVGKIGASSSSAQVHQAAQGAYEPFAQVPLPG